jgi:uncharacterized protein (TIGR00730 family)
MKRICVFAGSNLGRSPEYKEAARALGQEMVTRGLGLVYGGSSVGLMGVIADTILAAGGEVIGAIPKGLFLREVAHRGITQLYEVDSMHERKALMADLADGFIALPGGLGTFDELCEIITWAQIGIHQKPIGLLNVAGYFEPFKALITHATNEGFVSAIHARLLLEATTAPALLDILAAYQPSAALSKWDISTPEP